jgi:hypothetical protein
MPNQHPYMCECEHSSIFHGKRGKCYFKGCRCRKFAMLVLPDEVQPLPGPPVVTDPVGKLVDKDLTRRKSRVRKGSNGRETDERQEFLF